MFGREDLMPCSSHDLTVRQAPWRTSAYENESDRPSNPADGRRVSDNGIDQEGSPGVPPNRWALSEVCTKREIGIVRALACAQQPAPALNYLLERSVRQLNCKTECLHGVFSVDVTDLFVHRSDQDRTSPRPFLFTEGLSNLNLHGHPLTIRPDFNQLQCGDGLVPDSMANGRSMTPRH